MDVSFDRAPLSSQMPWWIRDHYIGHGEVTNASVSVMLKDHSDKTDWSE